MTEPTWLQPPSTPTLAGGTQGFQIGAPSWNNTSNAAVPQPTAAAQSNFMKPVTSDVDLSLAGADGTYGGMQVGGYTPPTEGIDWKGGLEGFSLGAQGLAGLMGAYNGYKQIGLMDDQLALQTRVTNANLARADESFTRDKAAKDYMSSQLT